MTDPVAPVNPVTPVAPVVRPRRTNSILNVLLAVAALVAVAGVAFAVGRFTTPAATAAGNRGTGAGQFGGQFGGPRASGAPGTGGGGFGRGFGGAASIEGTVTATTSTSLTISLPNGQSVTFTIDPSTTYHRQTAGASSDVATGKQVIVQLTGRGFGGGGGAGGASPAPSGPLTAGSVTVVTP
jgi:hypothetical protein